MAEGSLFKMEIGGVDLLGREQPHRSVPLFVIRKKGRASFWARSGEHGTGWHDLYPKQSFSKSEVAAELSFLIEQGWFCDLEVLQLHLR